MSFTPFIGPASFSSSERYPSSTFMVAGAHAGIITPLAIIWSPRTRRRACSITSLADSRLATMSPRPSRILVMLPECVLEMALMLAGSLIRQSISSPMVISSPGVTPRAS